MSGAAPRKLELLAILQERLGVVPPATAFCQMVVRVTGVSGAAISLVANDVSGGLLGSSDEISRQLDELQFEMGEGPSVQAHGNGHPALVPDLAGAATTPWVAFAGQATTLGVAAVFAFPLRVGAARLGTLCLYRRDRGELTDQQHADALLSAELITQWILAEQAGAAPGELPALLEASADLRLVVHQAAGMLAVQLQVSLAEAMVRLRAHALSDGQSINEIAESVVARRLRLPAAHAEEL